MYPSPAAPVCFSPPPSSSALFPRLPFSQSCAFFAPDAELGTADLERRYFTETATEAAALKMQKLLLQIWHKFKLVIGANTKQNSCRIKEKYLKRVAETFPKWESFLCCNIEMIQPKLANVKIKKNHKDHECTMWYKFHRAHISVQHLDNENHYNFGNRGFILKTNMNILSVDQIGFAQSQAQLMFFLRF